MHTADDIWWDRPQHWLWQHFHSDREVCIRAEKCRYYSRADCGTVVRFNSADAAAGRKGRRSHEAKLLVAEMN